MLNSTMEITKILPDSSLSVYVDSRSPMLQVTIHLRKYLSNQLPHKAVYHYSVPCSHPPPVPKTLPTFCDRFYFVMVLHHIFQHKIIHYGILMYRLILSKIYFHFCNFLVLQLAALAFTPAFQQETLEALSELCADLTEQTRTVSLVSGLYLHLLPWAPSPAEGALSVLKVEY